MELRSVSIIVALDAKSQYDALTIADQLDPSLCRLKVGKELFTHEGSSIVKALHDRNFEVFLDLKFQIFQIQRLKLYALLGIWVYGW